MQNGWLVLLQIHEPCVFIVVGAPFFLKVYAICRRPHLALCTPTGTGDDALVMRFVIT